MIGHWPPSRRNDTAAVVFLIAVAGLIIVMLITLR